MTIGCYDIQIKDTNYITEVIESNKLLKTSGYSSLTKKITIFYVYLEMKYCENHKFDAPLMKIKVDMIKC